MVQNNQNGLLWTNSVQNGSNGPESIQNGPKVVQKVHYGPNSSKIISPNNRSWSNSRWGENY